MRQSLLDSWPKPVAVCLWFWKAEEFSMEPNGVRMIPCGLGRWAGALFFTLALGVAATATIIELRLTAGVITGIAGLMLLGVAAAGRMDKQIKAGIRHDTAKGTAVFTLSLDQETV